MGAEPRRRRRTTVPVPVELVSARHSAIVRTRAWHSDPWARRRLWYVRCQFVHRNGGVCTVCDCRWCPPPFVCNDAQARPPHENLPSRPTQQFTQDDVVVRESHHRWLRQLVRSCEVSVTFVCTVTVGIAHAGGGRCVTRGSAIARIVGKNVIAHSDVFDPVVRVRLPARRLVPHPASNAEAYMHACVVPGRCGCTRSW